MKGSKLTAFLLGFGTFLVLTPPPPVEGLKCYVCSTPPGGEQGALKPCSDPAKVDCSKRFSSSPIKTCRKETGPDGIIVKDCGLGSAQKQDPGCSTKTLEGHKGKFESTFCICEGELCNGGGTARPRPKIGLLTLTLLLGLTLYSLSYR